MRGFAAHHAVDWQADWIYLEGQDRSSSAPAPFMRKEFKVNKAIREARVFVTALGLYQLRINGRQVGDAEFLPGWTDYHQRVPYHEFEVTGSIQSGGNAIGAMLGDGWYCGYLGWQDNRQVYGEYPELLLQLEITFEDGTQQIVTSDQSWKVTTGPILESDIYNGEIYDARLELTGWDLPGFADNQWKSTASRPRSADVILEPARHSPVRAIETVKPQKLWQVEPGRWVFDLGQNMVGWARITVPGVAGQATLIRFAEMLEKDRTLYTENYRSARSTDTYIAKGSQGFETWEPLFTFHGFRYVELSGLDPNLKPSKDWVTGVVLHSDLEQIGHFACSNPTLNQLQSNIVWGQKGNFLEVPTDCPQRDERLGWTGDAQVFCPTACFNFDTLAFFKKWMVDMRDSQNEAGAFPHVVPNVLGEKAYDSPAWADAGVIIPWEVYIRYGDKAILEDNFDAMRRWIEYQQNHSPGLIREDRGFGDWLQPYQDPEKNRRGDTAKPLIGTAHFAYTTRLTAKTAQILGHTEEAERLSKLAEQIRQAFQKEFWTDENRLTSDTQTAYLLALAFDLLPEKQRPAAVANLLRLIDEAEKHLRTGFVGTPLLAPVLTRFGHLDLAYTILLKETYPGWIYSIRQGATTMWERWNSYSHADGFGDASMNSFNHYAYGAIGQWMYETIAGLAPDPEHPGYRHFFIQPQPGGDITWARAELKTPQGQAASGWRYEGDILVMESTVPDNSTATVVFPFGTPRKILYRGRPLGRKATSKDGITQMTVGPGKHSFMVRP